MKKVKIECQRESGDFDSYTLFINRENKIKSIKPGGTTLSNMKGFHIADFLDIILKRGPISIEWLEENKK